MTVKKHGIIITEHKHWNTKTIYNNGHRMITYRHQPKLIRFESPMVNDLNQHACGGWSMSDLPYADKIIESQLLAGCKPLGEMTYEVSNKDAEQAKAIDARIARLRDAGLRVLKTLRPRHGHSYIDIEACQQLYVRDIGDLDLLKQDYADAGIEIHPETYADMHLKAFLGSWGMSEQWLAGLLLGYPVENTISWYLGEIT